MNSTYNSSILIDPKDIILVDPTERMLVDPTDIMLVDPTDIMLVDPTGIMLVDPTDIVLIHPGDRQWRGNCGTEKSENSKYNLKIKQIDWSVSFQLPPKLDLVGVCQVHTCSVPLFIESRSVMACRSDRPDGSACAIVRIIEDITQTSSSMGIGRVHNSIRNTLKSRK